VSVVELYEASPVKAPPRQRATQAEIEERARWFINYGAKHGPVTVRQLYYRAVVEGITGIEKTDSGYAKVQRQVLNLRRAKRLSYEYIADATRWMRKPHTWDSVQEALHETARLYRKSLWQDADSYFEIWVEKDALAGVIYPVTSEYDVPLMVARGFASETFCFEAIESREDDRPSTTITLVTSTAPAVTPQIRCRRNWSGSLPRKAWRSNSPSWQSMKARSVCSTSDWDQHLSGLMAPSVNYQRGNRNEKAAPISNGPMTSASNSTLSNRMTYVISSAALSRSTCRPIS